MYTSAIDAIYTVADLMAAAALTAPKTSGQDKIVTLVMDGEEKEELSRWNFTNMSFMKTL